MSYGLAFAASFLFVALKSWQQLNVARRKYPWILPTSMAMAVCEVYVIANVAQFGFGWLVFWVGLGGGLGSTAATFLHWRVMR
jgi:hypothetical protein